jgi:hypothetical protein
MTMNTSVSGRPGEHRIEIGPIGILALDEVDLPLTRPFLHGLLALDSCKHVLEGLIVDEALHAVSLREAWNDALAMLTVLARISLVTPM